jgi:hypothetical protein
MAACDPQILVDGAKCIECQIPAGFQLPVLIYLTAQLAGVDVSSKAALDILVQNASCLECQLPAGMQNAVLIFLTCKIAGI